MAGRSPVKVDVPVSNNIAGVRNLWQVRGMAVPSSTAPERSDGTTMSGGAQTTASECNDERGTMRRQPRSEPMRMGATTTTAMRRATT